MTDYDQPHEFRPGACAGCGQWHTNPVHTVDEHDAALHAIGEAHAAIGALLEAAGIEDGPEFPTGVHDIVSAPSERPGIVRLTCAMGDWGPVLARVGDEERWARRAGYEHSARHGRVPCHTECLDEPGCLYDGVDA